VEVHISTSPPALWLRKWVSHYATKKLGDAVMSNFLSRFAKDESGATAIEYGLIAALIGVAIVTGAKAVGDNLGGLFNNIATDLKK